MSGNHPLEAGIPNPHLFPPPSYSHQPVSNQLPIHANSSVNPAAKSLSQLGMPPTNNTNTPSSSTSSVPSHSLNDSSHRHKFSLSKLSNWTSETKNFRIQGWDPILIIAQILAIQALHYLALSLLTPPLLSLFSSPQPLEYEGGPANVAMIMDWREMAGYGTLHRSPNRLGGWAGYGRLPNALGRRPLRVGSRQPGMKIESGRGPRATGLIERVGLGLGEQWGRQLQDAMLTDLAADPRRRWVLSLAWFLASLIGVSFLYHIVRRPIHIMDHSLTICLNHLILTTYYSAAFPTSVWFYTVLILSSIVQIVWAENMCVKREMREGLGVGWKVDHRPDDLPKTHNGNNNNNHLNNQTNGNPGGTGNSKSNHHHHHHLYEKVPQISNDDL